MGAPTPGQLTPPTRGRTAISDFKGADVTAAMTSVFSALAVALVAAYASTPLVRPWLADAGGLLDWFRVSALLGAVLLGAWAARRSTDHTRFRLVVPAASGWALADHFGYGLGMIGWTPFTLGGVSVHSSADLGRGLGAWVSPLGIGTGLAVTALLLVGLGAWSLGRSAGAWAEHRMVPTERRLIGHLVLAGALLAAAPMLGLLGPEMWVAFSMRLAGLMGSVMLLLAALATADHRRTVAGWRSRIRPWMNEPRTGPLPEHITTQ